MIRLIPVALFFLLGACGEQSEDAPPPVVAAKSDGAANSPRPKEEVERERRAMGRWRSEAGILPGVLNQWIILDIAGTKEARMEVRKADVRRQSVTEFATGEIVVTPTGIDVKLPNAKGALADFHEAKGVFASTSKIYLTGANGRKIDLTYDGQ